MIYGGTSYGSVEYSGELGPLTITGTCACTIAGESCTGYDSVAAFGGTPLEFGFHPAPQPQPKPKKQRVYTGDVVSAESGVSVEAQGKVRYSYRGVVELVSVSEQMIATGNVDDTSPREEEEVALILSLLEN